MKFDSVRRIAYTTCFISAGFFSSVIVHAATIQFDPTNTYVTGIAGLNIGGTSYYVSLHLNTSFNDLFDPDADRNLDKRPTFLHDSSDPSEAIVASSRITAALGTDKKTAPNPYVVDYVLIPYAWSYNPSDSFTYISTVTDTDGTLASDNVSGGGFSFFANQSYPDLAIATFSEVSPVPLPATVWLFASALGVLGYTGWRKKSA